MSLKRMRLRIRRNCLTMKQKENLFKNDESSKGLIKEKHMNKFFVLLLSVLLMSLSGCMEIETRIIMQLDGSAVVKETIRVHKELLDFKDDAGKPIVMEFLEKQTCEARAKNFGTGAVLVGHTIKSLNGGVKMSEAEYKIPDIKDLCIINPFLCYTNYADLGTAKITLTPVMMTDYFGHCGEVRINVVTEKPGVSNQKRWQRGEPLIKIPSPAVLQKYRLLQPVFKDLMKEFKVSVVFESYASLKTNYGLRDRTSQPRSCEIFSFSGADYDNVGGLLLDNDEIMQELLRLSFWDINFVRAFEAFPNNMTVPVCTGWGSPYGNVWGYGGPIGISFKASKPLWTKYFEGKTLDLGPWRKHEKVPADFEKYGFDPEKDTRKIPAKAAPAPAVETPKPVVEPGK